MILDSDLFAVEIYDIVMLVVLMGAAIFGAAKGFAWQLASIASIVLSYFVALKFRGPFSESIAIDPPWNRFLAMLILYIASALVIWVAFRMVSNSIDRMKLREFDRHIGAVFGLLKGSLYCILITLFAVTLAGESIREIVVGSRSGHFIADVLDRSESVIPPEIHEIVDPYLQRFDEEFSESTSGLSIANPLPQLASDPASRSEPSQWSPESIVEQSRRQLQGAVLDAQRGTPESLGGGDVYFDQQQATRPSFQMRR